MGIRFHKMHGLGNDFIIIESRTQTVRLTQNLIQTLSDRHIGVGCDQLVVLHEPSASGASVQVRFYNPDGSEAGACGNASRCVARLLGGEPVLQTQAGLLPSSVGQDGRITINMGRPKLGWSDIPLSKPCDTICLPILGAPSACSMGNPHVTFFDGIAAAKELGPVLECDPLFPEKTNVGFVDVMKRNHMRLRVWERGAGLTMACGSGACAAVVNGVRRGMLERRCRVTVDGGELEIFYRDDDHVLMTGPTCYVFEGNLLLD